VAGNGTKGFSGDGGVATNAQFDWWPPSIVIDSSSNLYVSDHHCIRKVDPTGIISTVAGNGFDKSDFGGFAGDGGPATGAQFGRIEGIAVDGSGNLYVADADNQRVRKIDTVGTISTIAGNGFVDENGYGGFCCDGGVATNAQLSYPWYVAVDNSDNLYIADTANHRIRKINTIDGIITTVAGNGVQGFSGDSGQATSAQLDAPKGITVDNKGNLYIADHGNYRIRKVDVAGIISSVAGNGTKGFSGDGGIATNAQFDWWSPNIAVDNSGNLYVTDRDNNRIRKVTFSNASINQPPKADYYASPNNGPAPLTVTLDASPSSDSDGSIVNYLWSVNGQTLTGMEKAGDYPITLTVTDDKGATGTKTYTITVSSPAVTAPKIRIEPTALNFDNTQGVKKGLRNANDLPVEVHKIPSNQELFVETGLPIEEHPADPIITRLRNVGINLNALSQPDATFGEVYAEQVTLNLFPDVSFTVNNTSVNYRAENDYTWVGKIEGTQFGDVILVVKNGRITGNINVQGEVYRIRPSQDSLHVIQKMNPTAFPEDAPSVSPPSIPSGALSGEGEQRSQPRSARITRDSSTPIIDVMVVYTPVAAQTPTDNKVDIVSEIQLAVDETNQVYANSGIKQRLRLVHTEQVNYQEVGLDDLARLKNPKDGFLDEVHRLRDIYQADLVSLWKQDREPPYCGQANLMNYPSKGFAIHGFTVIERTCATAPVYAFAHELGHDMGAHHAMYEAKGEPGAYPYSHGYVHDTGDNTGWRTIMAYEDQCIDSGHLCPRIPYFSNPDIMYNGVATGDSSANNALTFNNTADIVASFRESSSLLTEETKKFTIYNDGNA